MKLYIRPETPADIKQIHSLTRQAFASMAHSSNTEHLIVDKLRERQALTISLVAELGNSTVGHVAVSPVTIEDGTTNWFGLGPISVAPEYQGKGIGSALMEKALGELKERGAGGCILLGDPNYYKRFGFEQASPLTYSPAPSEYFQSINFTSHTPRGEVEYHQAFSVQA